MKKTRSEINKEIKNSNISVLSEQDLTLKRKKTKTSTNNISKIDDNLSSQNETKENKLDIAFTKLFNHIKKLIEKYEVKPEVSDKEYEFTGDKFYKILDQDIQIQWWLMKFPGRDFLGTAKMLGPPPPLDF